MSVLEAPKGNKTKGTDPNVWVTESNLMAVWPLNMQEIKLHDQMTSQAYKIYIKYVKLSEIIAACMLYIFFCIYKILEILRYIILPGISLDVTGGTQTVETLQHFADRFKRSLKGVCCLFSAIKYEDIYGITLMRNNGTLENQGYGFAQC